MAFCLLLAAAYTLLTGWSQCALDIFYRDAHSRQKGEVNLSGSVAFLLHDPGLACLICWTSFPYVLWHPGRLWKVTVKPAIQARFTVIKNRYFLAFAA